MKLKYRIILILSIVLLNLTSKAQQEYKICGKDDPFTELDWIVNYPADNITFSSVELNGEVYIKASDKGYYTCDGELYCNTAGENISACADDFTANGLTLSSTGDETDLSSSNHSYQFRPVEGYHNIFVSWINNGPGALREVDLVLEINGETDTIQKWTGNENYYSSGPLLPGKGLSAWFSHYLEPETTYNFKVTAVNPNGKPDLNPEDNFIEFTVPAYKASYDLALVKNTTASINPLTGEVRATVNNVIDHSVENGSIASLPKNFTIKWSVNNVDQPPYLVEDYAWFYKTDSKLVYNSPINFTIGNLYFGDQEDLEIKIWVELPDQQTDAAPDNNSITYYYSAKNKVLYDADITVTMCKGDSITLEHPGSYVTQRDDCTYCHSIFKSYRTTQPPQPDGYGSGVPGFPNTFDEYLWLQNGEYVSSYPSILVKPNESRSYTNVVRIEETCYDICRQIEYASTTASDVFIQYSVIVLDCFFENNNWVSNIIDPENCNGETVTVYDKGAYKFVLINKDGERNLYFEDGTFYCAEMRNSSCLEAYGLEEIFSSWTCENNTNSNNENVSVFNNYSWLNDIIDQNNCNTQSITVYNDGTHQFLIIDYEENARLYETSGTFYFDSPTGFGYLHNNDAYEVVEQWVCNQTNQGRYGMPKIQDKEIQIFPNPTKDKVFINLQQLTFEQPLISIYDVNGKRVKQITSAEAFAGIVQLNVNDLERGIYLVEVRASENILTKKLLIQ